MDHHHLSTINQSRIDWRVKVRVTRIWPTLSKTGVAVRYNLILLDCQHNHIHAVVPLSLWPQYVNLINESGLYRVSNFHVVPSSGVFRPVNCPLSIVFSTLTTVVEVPFDDSFILMHKFKFTAFEDLYREALEYGTDHRALHSTDVIGVMENLQQLQTTQTNNGVERVVRFTISDGRFIFDVCFRDPLNFEIESLYDDHVDIPVIVILASTRLNIRDGIVTISNLDSTKVYINLGHQDVFMMRQRVINSPFFTSLKFRKNKMYHNIKQLDRSDTCWRIRVRVVRMWPSISPQGDLFHGINLILLDEEEFQIHAFILSKFWDAYTKLLLEGLVYEISDFWVKEAIGTLRPVTSAMCIYFKDSTSVKRITIDSLNIPMNKFELLNGNQIFEFGGINTRYKRLDDPIDTIGVVEDLQPVQCVQTSCGFNRFVCFTIRDKWHRMNVTFWDEHISSLYPLIEQELKTPTIVILASIKARLSDGVIQLDTMQCTRIYFNLEHNAVSDMRECYRLHTKEAI